MLNLAIFAGSIVVLALFPWRVRRRATVDDVDYMKAMIPHHCGYPDCTPEPTLSPRR